MKRLTTNQENGLFNLIAGLIALVIMYAMTIEDHHWYAPLLGIPAGALIGRAISELRK